MYPLFHGSKCSSHIRRVDKYRLWSGPGGTGRVLPGKGLARPVSVQKATFASREAHVRPSGTWYGTAIQMDWRQESLVLIAAEECEKTASAIPPPAPAQQMTSLRCTIALLRAVPLISRLL
ncbi:hypothetical protein MAPG_02396 [Magnaporthiopsis poae ATCC 64411]|uniref:Uncharacterized protein n=1 Tax=Magnaporthiopsis poae (strain ATCC 64411 / 73-15) TaxID=644358 RepID=A0A0C4DR90_MAGP6|nr:hypothetical protein MAPG_02396 [Magnaporthiopsis poae ATCC 64411]